MQSESDDAALADVVHAARLILSFTHGMDRTAFLADLKTQSAVLHQILILGEAVKRLSDPFRDSHPHISWSQIARMRDRVIHHYDTVDLKLVWNVVEQHIPSLLAQLEPLVPPEPDKGLPSES